MSLLGGVLRKTLPSPALRAVRQVTRRPAPWDYGKPTHVPAIPPGQQTGLPDFIGVGVQRAGTTWWYNLIAAHPSVHDVPDQSKERHWFLRETCVVPSGDRNDVAYERLFPRPPRHLVGEWTPQYLHHPVVMATIVDRCPDARLLILLRDPVARMVSGLQHRLDRSGRLEPRDFSDAFTRGLYGQQLSFLLDMLPDPARLLVLQYEQCRADPAGALGTTYKFLGIDPTFVPPAMGDSINATLGRHELTVTSADRAAFTRAYEADLRRLAGLVPEFDLSLWPAARFL